MTFLTKLNRIRIKKLVFLLSPPILALIIFVEIGIYIIQDYYIWSGDLEKTIEISTNSSLTLLATGMGIFTPLWIERRLKKREKRRLMIFSISATWIETRSNLHTLKTVRDNFNFESSLTLFIQDPVNNLDKILMKYSSNSKLVKIISTDAYRSMISSNTISYLENDDIYNQINVCYETIEGFISEFTITESALTLRQNSYTYIQGLPSTQAQRIHIINDVKTKLKNVKRELDHAVSKTELLKSRIEKEVSNFGPKIAEIPRDIKN